MKELLEMLLSTTQGTVFLFIVAAGLVSLIVWLCVKVIPRIRSFEKGKIILDKIDGVDVKLIPCNKERHDANILIIKGIIGDEYEKYLISKEELNTRINVEIQNIQQLALTRAIEHVCLEFTNIYEETAECSLSKMGQILELYLHRDFTNVLLHRFDMLKESSSFLDKTDLEINNEVQAITEDCIRSMKLKIKAYVLISDSKLLYKLFDVSTEKIKETVDEAIINFIKLSRDQQNKLIDLTKKRTQAIEEKLANLIGTVEEEKLGEK